MMSQTTSVTVEPEVAEVYRDQVSAGSFWLIVPGIVCILMTFFEGSAVWSALILASAYLGFSGGFAGGDGLLEMQRRRAAGEAQLPRPEDVPVMFNMRAKLARPEDLRGMFNLRTIFSFWAPQIFFLFVLTGVAKTLSDAGTGPRSLKTTDFLVMIESMATYFMTIGAAFYKSWQWSRSLPARPKVS